MALLAHSGHWAVYVLYALPVVLVIGTIVVSALRGRGDGDEAGEPDEGGSPGA